MKNKLTLGIVIVTLILIISQLTCAASREDALIALESAKSTSENLKYEGYPYLYVSDTLNEANLALERADYAQLLKDNTDNSELAYKAREALEGLNYEGFTYSAVIELTDTIQERAEKTYYLNDLIRANELQLDEYKEILDLTAAFEKHALAKAAFDEERFSDAESLISESDNLFHEKISEQTTFNALVNSGKSIASKFWGAIAVILAVILLSFLGFRKHIEIYRLNGKYSKMKTEQTTLIELIKKTQRDRYEQGSISDYLYKIKMRKYQEKLAKVRAELPAVKSLLNKNK